MVFFFVIFFVIFFLLIVGFLYYVRWESRLLERSKNFKKVEKELDHIEKALKEYAFKEPRLAEILKNVGIM